MADQPAARLGDPVGHSLGMAGMIGGALLGAAVGGALVFASVVTGGVAAVAVAGLVAGGALSGGQLANGLQTVLGAANPTTGLLAQGSPDVRVNGKPAVRAGPDFVATCSGLFATHHFPMPRAAVAEGSATVRINGRPAARVQDRLICAATITTGSPNVRIGGGTRTVLAVHDREATWTKVATVVGLASLGGGLAAAAAAGAAALAGFVAVGAGFAALTEGLGQLGDRLGPGWRDVLQGGAGVAGIVAGAPRGARALAGAQSRAATRARIEANVAESRAARGAHGRPAVLSEAQQARAARKLAASRERSARTAAIGRAAPSRGGSVWHATAKPQAAQGVLNGIDPRFLNPSSRFGAAFYVAEQPGTALAELAHHGVAPTTGIRFQLNRDAMRTLDLTDPNVASAWGYHGGPITPATQAIGERALARGYNVIRFHSERAPGGVNQAVLDDFNQILRPVMVTPAQP